MDIKEIISISTDIQFGKPVFTGSRVTVETLFDHLEAGISLDDFLDDFPTVRRDQAVGVLETASKLLNSKNLDELYAHIA